MMISDFNIKEIGLSATNDIPSGNKPEFGDVWITKDDRVIVVTKIDQPSFGNITRIHACINGEFLSPNIEIWPMVLLSLQASPVGRVRK